MYQHLTCAHTYPDDTVVAIGRLDLPQQRLEVAQRHVLHHHQQRIGTEVHGQQSHNVYVVEMLHARCFSNKRLAHLTRGTIVEHLDGNAGREGVAYVVVR